MPITAYPPPPPPARVFDHWTRDLVGATLTFVEEFEGYGHLSLATDYEIDGLVFEAGTSIRLVLSSDDAGRLCARATIAGLGSGYGVGVLIGRGDASILIDGDYPLAPEPAVGPAGSSLEWLLGMMGSRVVMALT